MSDGTVVVIGGTAGLGHGVPATTRTRDARS